MAPGDDVAGPRVVPVYALTGGRTRAEGVELHVETLLSTTRRGLAASSRLRFENARIVELCRRPVSVAEVAARLQVPLGVAQVLVADLHAEDLLRVHRPTATPDGRPRTEVLERLLSGLKGQ
jgi:Protein of unknown function (DUF742)